MPRSGISARPFPYRGTSTAAPAGRGADTVALDSARRTLRRRSGTLVLGCFVLYALLSCFAPGAMAVPVAGSVNLGFLVAAAHLVLVGGALRLHDRFALRRVDTLANRLVATPPHGDDRAGAGSHGRPHA